MMLPFCFLPLVFLLPKILSLFLEIILSGTGEIFQHEKLQKRTLVDDCMPNITSSMLGFISRCENIL